MQCYQTSFLSQEILGEEHIPPGSHEENNALSIFHIEEKQTCGTYRYMERSSHRGSVRLRIAKNYESDLTFSTRRTLSDFSTRFEIDQWRPSLIPKSHPVLHFIWNKKVSKWILQRALKMLRRSLKKTKLWPLVSLLNHCLHNSYESPPALGSWLILWS